MKIKLFRLLAIVPRLLLALTFLISGVGKTIDSTDAVKLVEVISSKFNAFESLTTEMVFHIVVVELGLAILLLIKRNLIVAYIVSFLFVGFFTAILGFLYIDGVSISTCGCFGAFGFSGGLEITLGRNLVLLCLIVTGYLVEIQNEAIISK
ncbi:MAG: MauE/DoxX family redox-associated membrane protein [Balneola sp.]